MELYVRNWRCIEEVKVDLKPVTLLIGKNSTGKSSLAYAPYLLVKLAEWRDVNRVLTQLYGVELDGVVRSTGVEKYYPVVIQAGDSRFEASSAQDYRVPEGAPWRDGYLLPSQRLSFSKLAQFIPKLGRKIIERSPEAKLLLAFTSSIIELLKTLPILPPMYFFLEDFTKLYRGRGFLRLHRLGEVGVLIEEVAPLLNLITYEYEDPFTRLKIPLNLAPDGFTDLIIVRIFVEMIPEGSLLVVEEPEIHKNPLQIIDLIKYMARRAVERGLTLVMTTHSDIALQALAKTVEEEAIRTSQVAVYYLERSHEYPWTRIRELKVYEDGTIEELPDVEKAVALLF
ncbi:MAG: AAA family ATPase [Desulfurococcales archaeon]|nr:AAA family ATPase [Desulfurococcales archaeon]